jgi:hypothetical protein
MKAKDNSFAGWAGHDYRASLHFCDWNVAGRDRIHLSLGHANILRTQSFR